MVALRGMTIMPEMVVHFDVSREKSIAAIQEAMAGDQKIFLVAQRSIETDDPTQEDVYEVGTVGTIKQIMKLPKHIVRVLVSGETRGILKQLQQDTPYLRAEVEVIDESDLVIQDDLNGGISMEIILKEDVVNLGYKNDIVTVKSGYGRNYLIPTGKAVIASPSAKKMLAEELKQRAHKLEKIKKDAEAMAEQLKDVTLTIATKVSATGTIFGSVSNIQIAEELEKLGHKVDRKIIVVKDAVKEVGSYKAIVKLHKEVSVEIPFEVVAE